MADDKTPASAGVAAVFSPCDTIPVWAAGCLWPTGPTGHRKGGSWDPPALPHWQTGSSELEPRSPLNTFSSQRGVEEPWSEWAF